jgi:hypothetical protein
MSVQNQLLINKFTLPLDLCDIIKSFAFCDKERKMIKDKKKIICSKIRGALSLRNNMECDAFESLLWGFSFQNMNEKLKIEAVNCSDCGNYKWIRDELIDVLPHRIFCRCDEYNYGQSDDEDNNSMDGDYYD